MILFDGGYQAVKFLLVLWFHRTNSAQLAAKLSDNQTTSKQFANMLVAVV